MWRRLGASGSDSAPSPAAAIEGRASAIALRKSMYDVSAAALEAGGLHQARCLSALEQTVDLMAREAHFLSDVGLTRAFFLQHHCTLHFGVFHTAGYPFLRAISVGSEQGFNRANVITHQAASLLKMNLETSTFGALIVAGPLQAEHRIEDVFALAGASLRATFPSISWML